MAAMDVSGAEDLSCGKDGPVLTMMNKRLRALKKKLNRITQLEAAKNEGKAINKEQEDVLKSKVQVMALIEEYQRLREPLLAAVKEEIAEKEKEWSSMSKEEQAEDKDGVASNESLEEARTESEVTSNGNLENADENGGAGGDVPAAAAAAGDAAAAVDAAAAPPPPAAAAAVEESEKSDALPDSSAGSVAGLDENLLLDIIQLLYFALLFDVRPHDEAHSFLRTIKYHERVSCLSYDLVTDDSTSHLQEPDLDDLALFGSLVTSRLPHTTLSHRDALQACLVHARQWLLNSDAVIEENILNVTYAELREKLNRILALEYYTMTPELQTVTSTEVYQELVNGQVPNAIGNVSDSSGTNPDVSQLDLNPTKITLDQPVEDQQQHDDHRAANANPRQHQTQQGGFQQKYRNRGGGGNGGANYGRGRGRGDGSVNYGRGDGGANYGRGGRSGRGDGRGHRGGYPSNGSRGGGNAGNGGGAGGGQYYDQSGYYQRSGYYRRGRGYYNGPNNAAVNGPSPPVAS